MSLKDLLIRQISANGPISVAEYMQTCLLHPELGYYTTREVFGREGDFTTAPEISQMFGEMLGLCLVQAWLDQGAPAQVVLAEIGPGRGTLMRDMLRAAKVVAAFQPEVHLVEASEKLRAVQAETLDGVDVTWHDDVSGLPDAPLLLVANELFDALPIRQFTRQGAGWAERRVGVQDGALVFGLAAPSLFDPLAGRLIDTKDGDIVEYCPAAHSVVQTVSSRIAKHGGAALIVDYGDWRSLGDTFQALQDHKIVNPLAEPGMADLTAHVDFEALANAADCKVSRMVTQGILLERLGITARAQSLAKGLSATALELHIAAHRRLTHPKEMGTLFKAVALYPDGAPIPPGFDP